MAEIIVDIGDNLVETIGCEFKGDIVRCKECAYADKYYHCNYMTTWNNADDFCSWGKRKEGE